MLNSVDDEAGFQGLHWDLRGRWDVACPIGSGSAVTRPGHRQGASVAADSSLSSLPRHFFAFAEQSCVHTKWINEL